MNFKNPLQFLKGTVYLPLLCVLVGCSSLKDDDLEDESMALNQLFSGFTNQVEGIAYDVVFEPSLPSDLESILRSVSKLEKLQINRPGSISALLRRVQKDKDLFKDILSREGYLDRVVNVRIQNLDLPEDEEGVHNDKVTRVTIVFEIDLKDCYTIHSIHLKSLDSKKLPSLSESLIQDVVQLDVGMKINFDSIQNARPRIVHFLRTKGYPNPSVNGPIGDIVKDTHQISIVYPVRLGYRVVKEITVEGHETLDKQFILNRMAKLKDKPFNEDDNHKVRNNLIHTSIVNSITMEAVPIGDCVGDECPVTLKTTIQEDKPRSIGFGGRYSTALGLGGQVFWHHNNFMGGGEHLGATLKSSIKEQTLKLSFNLPDIGMPESFLGLEYNWIRENLTSYQAITQRPTLSYSVPFLDYFKMTTGLIYEKSHATSLCALDPNDHYDTNQGGVTFGLSLDSTNDLLDPSLGIRLMGSATPYWHLKDFSKLNMTTLVTKGSIYLPLRRNELGQGKLTLASMMKIGTIIMKNFQTEASPVNRFFSGGPGSIRSYGYQKVGPVDTNGIPSGGKSIVEWSTELRFRLNESLGFVVFFEAGNVAFNGTPQFTGKNTLYGAGFGLRYFSGIGPVRLDLGFPLKKRVTDTGVKVDHAFQLCISLGQAF